MRTRRLCLVLLLPLLAGARLQAQQATPEEIEALMAQSWLQGQIASLAPHIEEGILQKDDGLDPKRVSAFRKAMATAFAADRVQARARDFLQTKLGHEDVEQVARWYSSPLGKRIKELELKSGKAEDYLNTPGDLEKIVGAERLKRLERIEAAVQGAEAVLLLMKHSGTSIQKTKYLVWGVDLPLPPDVTERIDQLRPMIHRASLLTSADVLRDLTIEDLDRYVSFAESPSSRRWHRAAWDALNLVMAKGLEEVMAAMPKVPK
ncbi:MAG TPA: DUF2059 domain-containing protein [Thermoanaerobaculia bacterium]|jgi:hypothetical protein|nr:DUF2059 domain-containing protein [Thermoanaerobaculia bacterium]